MYVVVGIFGLRCVCVCARVFVCVMVGMFFLFLCVYVCVCVYGCLCVSASMQPSEADARGTGSPVDFQGSRWKRQHFSDRGAYVQCICFLQEELH